MYEHTQMKMLDTPEARVTGGCQLPGVGCWEPHVSPLEK